MCFSLFSLYAYFSKLLLRKKHIWLKNTVQCFRWWSCFSLIGNKRTDAYFNSYTKITGFQAKNSYNNMYMLYLYCHFSLKCWDWQVGWLWISFFIQLKHLLLLLKEQDNSLYWEPKTWNLPCPFWVHFLFYIHVLFELSLWLLMLQCKNHWIKMAK